MEPKVNTLKKKVELLKYLESRLKKLQKQEEKNGKFVAETRETITCIYNLLEKIRLEGGSYKPSLEEIREDVFGDWMRKGKNQSERRGK